MQKDRQNNQKIVFKKYIDFEMYIEGDWNGVTVAVECQQTNLYNNICAPVLQAVPGHSMYLVYVHLSFTW